MQGAILRYLVAALAVALTACTSATTDRAAAAHTSGPLDGFWDIETTQAPDSGCTFSGSVLMQRQGTSVHYRAVVRSAYACPDGRAYTAMQACDAYDLAVLQMNCSADPERSTAGYAGDSFSMLRPQMQASVDQMEGSIRLPESEYERLAGAYNIAPHLVRWTRSPPGAAAQ